MTMAWTPESCPTYITQDLKRHERNYYLLNFEAVTFIVDPRSIGEDLKRTTASRQSETNARPGVMIMSNYPDIYRLQQLVDTEANRRGQIDQQIANLRANQRDEVATNIGHLAVWGAGVNEPPDQRAHR
jgi:hypothetical protein